MLISMSLYLELYEEIWSLCIEIECTHDTVISYSDIYKEVWSFHPLSSQLFLTYAQPHSYYSMVEVIIKTSQISNCPTIRLYLTIKFNILSFDLCNT